MAQAGDDPPLLLDDPSTELSSNRTAMSFERTAMSSDRTLMSVIRTALSLIGFGLTIHSFLHSLIERLDLPPRIGYQRFALILIALGMLPLALGIGNHVVDIRARRRRRQSLCGPGLIALVMGPRRRQAVSALLILTILSCVLIFHIARATWRGVPESARPMAELRALADHRQAAA